MGMDIYAGTFTRYYARNWKTKAQQYAEANGMVFHRITPDGENLDDQDSPDVTEIQKAVSCMDEWPVESSAVEQYGCWPSLG